MKLTPEYLAGLFDGEGCIDVQRVYPQTGIVYVRPRVRMCMTMAAVELAYALQEEFGGHLGFRRLNKPTHNASWTLEWLSQRDMTYLLNLISPYLILKREQANLVLWWLVNASGRQIKERGYAGMEQAREAFVEELRAMKLDPQRLSGGAATRIAALMRQSDHGGNVVTLPETRKALG